MPTNRPRWRGIPLVIRLTRADVVSHPLALAASVATGGTAAVVLATAPAEASAVGPVGLALLALLAVPAAVAGGTDPAQRHQAVVLRRLGVGRGAVWAAVLLAATLPVTTVGLVALVLTSALRSAPVDHDGIFWALVLLPMLGATLTASARSAGDTAPEHHGRRRSGGVVRFIGGTVLVSFGAAIPTTARSGSDLDLFLPVGTTLVLAGLILSAPGLLGVATRLLRRVPWTTARLGAAILDRNRRALTLPVALTAGAACVLVVQGILGVGLGRREADRVAALEALGPATAGTSDRQVLYPSINPLLDMVGGRAGDPVPDTGGPPADPSGAQRVAQQQSLVTATYPGAAMAQVRTVHLAARAGDPVHGIIAEPPGFLVGNESSVALATPELLTVLGLDPSLSNGEEAIVLDPRALRSDGTVVLDRRNSSDARTSLPPAPPRSLPARASGLPGVPVALPDLLVPPHLLPDDEPSSTSRVAALLPEVPDAVAMAALADPIRGEPTRGDEPVDLAASSRTDRMTSVWVRTSGDVWDLLLPFLLATLVIHWISQTAVALAHRHDDEVLDVLGAGPRHRVEHGVVRGAIVGVTSVMVGAMVGGGATAAGLVVYNLDVAGGPSGLAPIPFGVPSPVVVGLLGLALTSAFVGGLVGVARRRSDPVTRAERLAW